MMAYLHIPIQFAVGMPGVSRMDFKLLSEAIEKSKPVDCEQSVDELTHWLLAMAVESLADKPIVLKRLRCGQRVYFTLAVDGTDWGSEIARLEAAWLN
jgi:hypothetical protein